MATIQNDGSKTDLYKELRSAYGFKDLNEDTSNIQMNQNGIR